MPQLVTLPGRMTPPPRKRGRDHAAILAAYASVSRDEPPKTVSLRGKPHMAYDPKDPHRTEHARGLNARARRIVGVQGFGGYFAKIG